MREASLKTGTKRILILLTMLMFVLCVPTSIGYGPIYSYFEIWRLNRLERSSELAEWGNSLYNPKLIHEELVQRIMSESNLDDFHDKIGFATALRFLESKHAIDSPVERLKERIQNLKLIRHEQKALLSWIGFHYYGDIELLDVYFKEAKFISTLFIRKTIGITLLPTGCGFSGSMIENLNNSTNKAEFEKFVRSQVRLMKFEESERHWIMK
jgi:hypothetical protein